MHTFCFSVTAGDSTHDELTSDAFHALTEDEPGNKLMITIMLDSPLMLSTKTQDISLSNKERVHRKILPSRLR